RPVRGSDLEPGDRVMSPSHARTELTELRAVDCADEHHMEVYARVDMPAPDDDAPYPGDAAAKAFADGACAEQFAGYVGVDYRDAPAHLFFTYLVPSARSWSEGEDRTVTCFVTTTGAPPTASVAGPTTQPAKEGPWEGHPPSRPGRPAARSWSEGEDRTVTCFVTTTGAPLTGSVAGTTTQPAKE